MPADPIPPEIRALADARADARRARDWPTADRLKGEIERAGWKVIDAASLYMLERAAPPDVEEEGRVRYGSSAAVPSRLNDTPVGVATVVLVSGQDPTQVVRLVGALADDAPDGTQVVVVANGSGPDATEPLATLDARDPGAPGVGVEVVWTATRLGAAAAWNVGIRRAEAPVVVLVGEGGTIDGPTVAAIVGTLEDESVAVAGPVGLVTDDLRAFRVATPDAWTVDAIAGGVIGFRRDDAAARGLLDEHFVAPDYLDAWWSFVLRDPVDVEEWDEAGAGPQDAADEVIPPVRRAVQVQVAGRSRERDEAAVEDRGDRERARAAKRNFYRFLKRFATRRDLLTGVGDAER